MPLSVRASRREDAEDLVAIHERCWRISYAGLADPAWVIDRPVEERIAEWRGYAGGEGFPMWVATDGEGGPVIGFVAAGESRDEEGIGEVVALYVDPDHQGRGAGAALLERATRELRAMGFEGATLWTLENSPQSRGFYEQSGWRVEGARKSEESAPHIRYERQL